MDKEPILAFWSQYSHKNVFCVSWRHKFSIEWLPTGKFGSSRGGSTLWLIPSPHKPVSMGCQLWPWQVRNPLFLSFLSLRSPFSEVPSLVKPEALINSSVGTETPVNNSIKTGINVKLSSCRIYFRSLQKYTDYSKEDTGWSFKDMRWNTHTANVHGTRIPQNLRHVSSRMLFIHIGYPTVAPAPM